jgi:hypothetical protein
MSENSIARDVMPASITTLTRSQLADQHVSSELACVRPAAQALQVLRLRLR